MPIQEGSPDFSLAECEDKVLRKDGPRDPPCVRPPQYCYGGRVGGCVKTQTAATEGVLRPENFPVLDNQHREIQSPRGRLSELVSVIRHVVGNRIGTVERDCGSILEAKRNAEANCVASTHGRSAMRTGDRLVEADRRAGEGHG